MEAGLHSAVRFSNVSINIEKVHSITIMNYNVLIIYMYV